MSLQLSKLDDVPAANVAETLGVLSGLIQEKYPEVDLRRGVFHDLVLYFNSVLNTLLQENIDRVTSANSLLQIENDPTLADTDIVDRVLSNYNLTRDVGGYSTGGVAFVLATPQTTKFVSGTALTANGITYTLRATYTVTSTAAASLDGNYRVMTPIGNGTYVVVLPATATTVGLAGNIKAGAAIQSAASLDNVLSIYSATDFTGGRDPLSNANYLQRVKAGLSAKTIGGRASYEAFLRAQPNLENLLHVSVVGAGDPEQKRDQHSVIPISGGGRVDVYVQTAAQAQRIIHDVQATFIGSSAGGTLWQINIDRELIPGYYYFAGVGAAGGSDITANLYEIKNDYRVTNLYEINFTPDIQHYTESVYSRYQSGYLVFEDVDTPSAGLTPYASTKLYRLISVSMPLIREVDSALTARENRPRGTDILVKAAVPCFTRLAIDIHSFDLSDISTAVLTQMKYDIINVVQAIGFSGQLHASVIVAAVAKYLTAQQAVNMVDMFGKIRRPDGEWRYVRDNTVLKIPNDPEHMITSRTTVFLLGVDDIEIGITNVDYK
jgi:hypothetical protein